MSGCRALVLLDEPKDIRAQASCRHSSEPLDGQAERRWRDLLVAVEPVPNVPLPDDLLAGHQLGDGGREGRLTARFVHGIVERLSTRFSAVHAANDKTLVLVLSTLWCLVVKTFVFRLTP